MRNLRMPRNAGAAPPQRPPRSQRGVVREGGIYAVPDPGKGLVTTINRDDADAAHGVASEPAAAALFLAGGDFHHHVRRCWPLTQPSSPQGPQQRARSARRPPAAAPAAVRSRLAAVRANAGQRYYLSQESEEPRKSRQGAREVALACSPTCAMLPTG